MKTVDTDLPVLNTSHNFDSSGDRFISVELFSDKRILLNWSILAFVSGRWRSLPGRILLSFFRFDGGAVSSASTLAEGSPELVEGAVLVEVDVLGTFLFRPSRDVSMSLTERLRT